MSRRALILASPRVTALESMLVFLSDFLSGFFVVVAVAAAATLAAAASFFFDFLPRRDSLESTGLYFGQCVGIHHGRTSGFHSLRNDLSEIIVLQIIKICSSGLSRRKQTNHVIKRLWQ
mmetsp:Transcript_33324/g.63612  ORF Transcript_33324/g.63612 Transcript_33324/m.63612 type:complete len:119 (-) Transcript_33324:1359-1715(-)